MDTSVEAGVYKIKGKDVDTGRSNADVLYDLFSDLPIIRNKEQIPANWDAEMLIVNMHPDLVVIHRSVFFHAMNHGVQAGDRKEQAFPTTQEARWQALYLGMDDHLILFLGFVGMQNPRTKFLVYSRGTGGQWKDEIFRDDWVKQVEHRFPKLQGRITTMFIKGGLEGATFGPAADNGTEIRKKVQKILGLRKITP